MAKRGEWSIGFGLERIGVAAKRYPAVFTLVMALVSAISAWNITNVRFNGDVSAVLPEDSEAYRNYFANRERFRDFSRDVTVIVQSDRLTSAQGLEDLRFLQLEIAVTEGVENVTTIFSLPSPDPLTGEIGQFFPQEIASDEEASELLGRLVERWPQARSLIAPEENTAVLLVTLEADEVNGSSLTYPNFLVLREAVAQAAPQDFRVLYTGLTPIGGTIVSALVSDQLRLTLVGLALGTGIAFLVFRSLVAAVLCAVPPALTVIWYLGLVGWLQVPINYLTTVLPTLALIIAFADGIVLYFRWQSANSSGGDADANLLEAIEKVGPASALTSITTLLAFLSFSFASGTALNTFSWLGMAAVSIAFLAVIAGLPVACHWTIRLGLVRGGSGRMPAFGKLGGVFHCFASQRPIAIAVGAVVAIALLGVVHTLVRPEYRITDYLPKSSEVREAEAISNRVIGGRSLLLIAVPKAEDAPVLSAANRQRLDEVEALAARSFEAGRVISPAALASGIENPQALMRLSEQIEGAEGRTRSTVVSDDGSTMLITVRIPSDQAIAATLEEIRSVRADFATLPYGGEIVVTGFDVLMAEEFTRLIDQLRTSLVIAILLGVAVVGLATRSPLLALAALTPNLLPIFMVEFFVWLRGGTINLSEVIALTIAFGIAIDNAVHVINFFNRARLAGESVQRAVKGALDEVGPALAASTAIICASTLVTQISILPMVPVLGLLMISTLAVALFSNLAILPANILALKGLFGDQNSAEEKRETEEMRQ